MKRISTIQILLFTVVLFITGTTTVSATAATNDSLLNYLKSIVKTYDSHLPTKDIPLYYLSLNLDDAQTITIDSRFGAASVSRDHSRKIWPIVRVGSPEKDNYMLNPQNTIKWRNNAFSGSSYEYLPLDNAMLKDITPTVFRIINTKYVGAVEQYHKSNLLLEKKGQQCEKCFAQAPVEHYYEEPLDYKSIQVDSWKELLNEVSGVFRKSNYITDGHAYLDVTLHRRIFVDTEGSEIVYNQPSYSLQLEAIIKTKDGSDRRLHLDFFGFSEEELPSKNELFTKAEELLAKLTKMRDAPAIETYNGPVVFSGFAGGVLMHEILGHRLESVRSEKIDIKIKEKLNQKILMDDVQIYDDPTLKYYNGKPLSGYFMYDEEGSKAKRVCCVQNGVLRELLKGRTPIVASDVSNGHARAGIGYDPIARQSNLIIESSHPVTDSQLRKMLIDECKKQKKEYGYYIVSVSSGSTNIRPDEQSFRMSINEAYRIYVDGRPDEIVEKITIEGSPMEIMASIIAAGDSYTINNSYCGAVSGTVPISIVSPQLLVSNISINPIDFDSPMSTIPAPEYTQDDNPISSNEQEIIFKAMKDELERMMMTYQRTDSFPRPFYTEHCMRCHSSSFVISSHGKRLFSSDDNKINRTLAATVYLEDNGNIDKGVLYYTPELYDLSDEFDYNLIRRLFWANGLNSYNYAYDKMHHNHTTENKYTIDRKQSPQLALFKQLPAKEYVGQSIMDTKISLEQMTAMADELSSVFDNYSELKDSKVEISQNLNDYYRVTSNGQTVMNPEGNFTVVAIVNLMSEDGIEKEHVYKLFYRSDYFMSEKQSIIDTLHVFAQSLLHPLPSTKISEPFIYEGPVMYEKKSVTDFLLYGLGIGLNIGNELFAANKDTHELGQKVMDEKISIKQLAQVQSYKGQHLIGYYKFDIEGVEPKSLVLVNNGIIQNRLRGRTSYDNLEDLTGNERINDILEVAPNFGVLHITSNETVKDAKIRELLLQKAKERGLDYAYIFRSEGDGLKIVKINVQTAEEQLVDGLYGYESKLDENIVVSSISDEERVYNNVSYSIISPVTIIVDNIKLKFVPNND